MMQAEPALIQTATRDVEPSRRTRFLLWLALCVVLALLVSAATGKWIITPDRSLTFAPAPSTATAAEHKCALRATRTWSSCAAPGHVSISRCTNGSHPHGQPTYDCSNRDARPVFPPTG
jgi:hypothetical protein